MDGKLRHGVKPPFRLEELPKLLNWSEREDLGEKPGTDEMLPAHYWKPAKLKRLVSLIYCRSKIKGMNPDSLAKEIQIHHPVGR